MKVLGTRVNKLKRATEGESYVDVIAGLSVHLFAVRVGFCHRF